MINNQKRGTSHLAAALVAASLLLMIALCSVHPISSHAQPKLPSKSSVSSSSTPSKPPVSTSNVTAKNVIFDGKSVKIFVIGGLYGGAGWKSLDNFLTMNPGYEIKYIVPKQGSNATAYFFIVEAKH